MEFMEIAIWLAFGWTSKETALKFGPGRDLENVCGSHSYSFSELPMITLHDSDCWFESRGPQSHQTGKPSDSLVIHKGITKEIFGSSKIADFPDRFLIWRSKSTKVTPRKCTEPRECTDHSVSKVSAISNLGRLCTRMTSKTKLCYMYTY